MSEYEEEQYLMDSVEAGLSQPVSEGERQSVMAAVRNSNPKAISIRINENDLNEIKRKANRVGMPYQTLINTILHRYISGDIVLKEQI